MKLIWLLKKSTTMVKRLIKILLKPILKIIKFLYEVHYFLPHNIFCLLENRVRWEKRPLFQQKVFFNGLGEVKIGRGCVFGYKQGGFNYKGSIEIQARYKNSKIVIGDNVHTNNNIYICAANFIEIGDDVLIGQNVIISDHEGHGIEPENRRKIGIIGKVIIGKNVWIGNNVSILKNSEIGENSIVATGAVVSGIFPPNVIIGGVPAKIIKSIG